ncbi:Hypothetical protein MVR_LOCUS277 [uncultured virus]|nr:Hypothetical protein MVR_LOCUS277 [uncultured virus]
MELNLGDNEWEVEEPSLLASTPDVEQLIPKLSVSSVSSSDEELWLDSRFPRQTFGMRESTSRLANLDPAIHTVLTGFDEDIIFTAFLTELRRRCQKQNEDQALDCVNRMWHNMIHTHCLDFRRKHFKPRQTGIRSLSPELNTFMGTHTMTQLLQTIIDLAQARALNQAAIESLRPSPKPMSEPSLTGSGDAVRRNKWRSGALTGKPLKQSAQLEARFEEYVDLFELCTGIYREMATDTGSHSIAIPTNSRLGRSFSPVSMLHNPELKSKLKPKPKPKPNIGSILSQAGDSYRDADANTYGSSRSGFKRSSRGRGRGSSSDSDCDRGRSMF